MITQIYNAKSNPKPTPYYGFVTQTNCLQVVSNLPRGGIFENECFCLDHCLPAYPNDKGTFIYDDVMNLPTILQTVSTGGWVNIGTAFEGYEIQSGFQSSGLRVVTFDFATIYAKYGFGQFRLKIGSGSTAMYSQSFCLQSEDNCKLDGTVYIQGKLKGLIGSPNNQRIEHEFDREIKTYYRCWGKLFEKPANTEQTNIHYALGQIVSDVVLHYERNVVTYDLKLYDILLFNVRNIFMYGVKDCFITDYNFNNYSFNALNGLELVKQSYDFDNSLAPYTNVLPNATITLRSKIDNLSSMQ